ncbi:MAG: hypothetical protein ABI576_06005 [Flavobacterium sp.]
MNNKKINIFFIISLFCFTSCQELKSWLGIRPRLIEPIKCEGVVLEKINNIYDADFPPKGALNNEVYAICPVTEWFIGGGERVGYTGMNNEKEGIWLGGDADFDTNGDVYARGKIWREEYFKKGLRDSIFKQYDGNGKVIYETTFKMGTGLWKEFHSNGKLYFEAFTKDGYFTDTLKLYNEKGLLMEKRLYKKDSLIFKENMIIDDFPTDNK